MRARRLARFGVIAPLVLAGCSSDSTPDTPPSNDEGGAGGAGSAGRPAGGAGVGGRGGESGGAAGSAGTPNAGHGGAAGVANDGAGGQQGGSSGTGGQQGGSSGAGGQQGGSSGMGGRGGSAGTSGAGGSGGQEGGGGGSGGQAGGAGGAGAGGGDGSAGAGGSGGSGGGVACGHATEPCCSASPSCLDAGLVCGGASTCDPCGGEGQACCDGASCDANLSCTPQGTCECGDQGQSCCGGDACDAGYTCDAPSTTCACGGAGQACCSTSGPSCGDAALTCAGAACTCAAAIVGATGFGVEGVLKVDGSLWIPGTPWQPVTTNLGAELTGIVSATALGNGNYCVVVADNGGTALCWGMNNASGQQGNGTTNPNMFPSPVLASAGGQPLTGFTAIAGASLGTGGTVCGVAAGQAYCWGGSGGHGGLLGDGSTSTSYVPVKVMIDAATPLTGVDQIATSDAFACARKTDGTLWCWGDNSSGEIGIGAASDTPQAHAAQVTGLADAVVAVSVDFETACAVTNDGSLWCWGDNSEGQLGNGLQSGLAVAPVQVKTDATNAPFAGIAGVQLLNQDACAVKVDGSLWCWGTYWGGGLKPAPFPHGGPAVTDVWRLGRGNTQPSFITSDGALWLETTASQVAVDPTFPCP